MFIGGVAKGLTNLLDDLRSHRVVLTANGRADAGFDILGLGTIAILHRLDRNSRRLADGPQPSRMSQSDHPPDGVEEKDRHAIGKAHEKGYFRCVADQDVGSYAILLPAWRIGEYDGRGMGLPHIVRSGRIPLNGFEAPLDVRTHPGLVIANRAADVE